VSEHPESDYRQGVAAGRTDERLDGHDKHFSEINGSIKDLISEVHGMRLAVQQLSLQAIARDATVVTTAAALKDADQARRIQEQQRQEQSESRWSPMAKAIAIVGVLAAVVAAVAALVYGLRG
jgi:hypothetical protein